MRRVETLAVICTPLLALRVRATARHVRGRTYRNLEEGLGRHPCSSDFRTTQGPDNRSLLSGCSPPCCRYAKSLARTRPLAFSLRQKTTQRPACKSSGRSAASVARAINLLFYSVPAVWPAARRRQPRLLSPLLTHSRTPFYFLVSLSLRSRSSKPQCG